MITFKVTFPHFWSQWCVRSDVKPWFPTHIPVISIHGSESSVNTNRKPGKHCKCKSRRQCNIYLRRSLEDETGARSRMHRCCTCARIARHDSMTCELLILIYRIWNWPWQGNLLYSPGPNLQTGPDNVPILHFPSAEHSLNKWSSRVWASCPSVERKCEFMRITSSCLGSFCQHLNTFELVFHSLEMNTEEKVWTLPRKQADPFALNHQKLTPS